MDLEFDKYCVVDGSPTTVLPVPRHRSKPIYKKSNEKVKCGKDLPSLHENFTEISFTRFRSASCKDSRPTRANHELHKRGSVYQDSKDVNLLGRADRGVGRRKIELSRESASLAFPLGIIDSLCTFDEEDGSSGDQDRFSVVSTSEQSTSSYSINYTFSSKSRNRSSDNTSTKPAQDIVIEPEFSLAPVKDSNTQRERNSAVNLQKSLSSKSTYNVAQKKFDPTVKSRSHRSPLSRESHSEPICRRLLKDFSDNLNSVPPSSPAHLRGLLRSGDKNGLPFFEFSVNSPEEVSYIAKTWKVDDALKWVYTFHSLHRKRKGNGGGGLGFKGTNRESTVVGQMVVSSYLCTELKGAGAFNDSMVQEYVLYDIAQSRRSSSSSPEITKPPPLVPDHGHDQISARKVIKEQIFNNSRPLPAAELHPELEIAAVIMRAPFEKRESLKFKSGDREKNRPPLPSLLDLCRLDEEGVSGNSHLGQMHVVVPSGHHGLPSGENRGPSPLLDRWRSGGGCECGGWDMGCPLDVFVNPDFLICDGQLLVDRLHRVELFVQGRKKMNTPAFTMRAVEEGEYAVNFHARLSSLQAFSICVAILHAANTSAGVENETSKLKLKNDSVKIFAEEEIENLMDYSMPKEEKSAAERKKGDVFPSFVLNPPFSPIARV